MSEQLLINKKHRMRYTMENTRTLRNHVYNNILEYSHNYAVTVLHTYLYNNILKYLYDYPAGKEQPDRVYNYIKTVVLFFKQHPAIMHSYLYMLLSVLMVNDTYSYLSFLSLSLTGLTLLHILYIDKDLYKKHPALFKMLYCISIVIFIVSLV